MVTSQPVARAGEPTHLWITGPTKAARAQRSAQLSSPPAWTDRISANRRLRGPYTAAGTLLRCVVPAALEEFPDLVAQHEIEILSIAPELQSVIPATVHTLTSLAVPEERTRYYSSLRTLRLAHGLVELIRDYLRLARLGPLSVTFDDVEHADFTDQEFLAVLLRRIDPALLTVVIGCADSLAADRPSGGPRRSGLLPEAAEAYCRAVEADCRAVEADARPAQQPASLDPATAARDFIQADCAEGSAELRSAYLTLPDPERRACHDARAAEVAALNQKSLELGALRLHLTRGSDPFGAGIDSLLATIDYCMRMGFYDTALEAAEQGRAMCAGDDRLEQWLRLSLKVPTILSCLGFGDEAEAMCEEIRTRTDDPKHHLQLSYATAMLYTRHLAPSRQDHDRALGWINNAIALCSSVAEPTMRTVSRVFNQNGRALIEAHRGKPAVALRLVSEGIATLDAELGPDEHTLHRSVLRYNRGQVLASMGRVEEALADYHAVLEVDPNYPEYHFDVGNLLHRLGRDEEALAYYDRTMELSPPFPELHYNRADVLVDLDRIEEGLAAFSYVLELDPRHVDALLNRAGLLADLGEPELAEPDVIRGLDIAADNAHLLSLRGRLELEAGRLDQARTALDAAVRNDPSLAGAWALRGALNFEAADLAGALSDLSRAVELSPDPAVLFNRAHVLHELGRLAEAVADFDQVLLDAPDEPDALLERSRCHRLLGNHDAARSDELRFRAVAPERVAEIESEPVSA
ncbi:MAG: tetratricopeptide repeat protein [Jatrophihabitantaceae bacterium]